MFLFSVIVKQFKWLLKKITSEMIIMIAVIHHDTAYSFKGVVCISVHCCDKCCVASVVA